MSKNSLFIRKIALTAVFLGAALVLKHFSFDLPLFGASGVRISFSGIMSAMPAILFGPFYGAVTSALTDFLGFYVSAQSGAYMPLLTVTAALGGFTRGILWKVFKNKKARNIRVAIVSLAFCALVFGLYNMYALNADGVTAAYYETGGTGDTTGMSYISRLLISGSVTRSNPTNFLSQYITITTIGIIGFAGFCALLMSADFFISMKLEPRYGSLYTVQILSVMMLSGTLVNTLNTVILRELVFASWKLLPFAALWLPRIAEEMVSITVYTYFIVTLCGLYGSIARNEN